MRLNQFVAHSLGVSRRQADELIQRGLVSVNGKAAGLGRGVVEGDKVEYEGRTIEIPDYSYLIMNKPKGYVCSRASQNDNPTIYDLLDQEYKPLKIAGRLDKDSSGLIILTNDGRFADELMHPRYQTVKKYRLKLDKELLPEHIEQIKNGVKLTDGISQLRISGGGKEWNILLREGRNRQIRRTFGALGYSILKLTRTSHGPYSIGDLKPGEFTLVKKLPI